MTTLAYFFTLSLTSIFVTLWINRRRLLPLPFSTRTRMVVLGMGVAFLALAGTGYVRRTIATDTDDKTCLYGHSNGQKARTHGVMNGNGCWDTMHLNHVLLYGCVGIVLPFQVWKQIVLLSIIWELGEHVFFKYGTRTCRVPCCFRSEDIVLNAVGYFAGSFLGAG